MNTERNFTMLESLITEEYERKQPLTRNKKDKWLIRWQDVLALARDMGYINMAEHEKLDSILTERRKEDGNQGFV